MKLRYKLSLTLALLILVGILPVSVYIVNTQEKERIAAAGARGDFQARLFAKNIFNILLMDAGDITAARVDARELSAKQANEQGCKVIEGTPITVIQSRPPAPRPSGDAQAAAVPRPGDTRVDPGAQRARDTDSRRILEAELRREEGRLADLKREYNNGEPERQGNERNYQKYLDRVADLQSGIARKEGDIAAIKRELAKLPP